MAPLPYQKSEEKMKHEKGDKEGKIGGT